MIKLLNNKYVMYLSTRYVTYFVLFINSLLIAQKLGPYYFGIWGFITLIIQYFNNLNFGVPQSLTAILAINRDRSRYVNLVFNTTLSMFAFLSIIVGIAFLIMYCFNIGSVYNIAGYFLFIYLIVILNYYVMLFSNMFRIYNKLKEIAISQSAAPILTFITIWIIDSSYLVDALIFITLISPFLSLVLFVYNSPIRLKLTCPFRLMKKIQIRANFLFLYNTSFYFIMISTRIIISIYYSVSEFGFFTFSFTLANAILLLLESFSFLILPTMIHKLSKTDNDSSMKLLTKIQTIFVTLSHWLIHTALLFVPILFFFFDKYEDSSTSFRLLTLTLVLYTNSFGCSNLLIAKNKEKLLGLWAFVILLINITFVYIVTILSKDMLLSISITAVCYFIYSYALNNEAYKILNVERSFKKVFLTAFPLSLLIPYLISFIFVFSDTNNYFYSLPFAIYIFLNKRKLKDTFLFFKEIINRD